MERSSPHPASAPANPGEAAPHDLLHGLNPQQRQVAELRRGVALVIAGAGSGKTRALSHRCAQLLREGVSPDRVVLLTFTNRAARQMQERVAQLMPAAAQDLWVGTFHHIAHRVLRRFAPRLGYGADYGILDPHGAQELLALTLKARYPRRSPPELPKLSVLLQIAAATANTQRSLAQVLRSEHPKLAPLRAELDEIFTAWLVQKLSMNVMDYDDLLVNWRLLVQDDPEVYAQLRARFAHVMVDEYQDTNDVQAQIIERLVGTAWPSAGHLAAGAGGEEADRSLVVVGDDSQSIYAFRGADLRNLLEFPQRFGGLRGEGGPVHLLRLETNYRSTPQILAVANASIAHNPTRYEKRLGAVQPAGPLPAYVICDDEPQQAAFVAQRALELRAQGLPLAQQVVLYRAHHQAHLVAQALAQRGVPYAVAGAQSGADQPHLRALLAYLKIVHNPLDGLAWMQVLGQQPGLGPERAAPLYALLASEGQPWIALGAQAQLPQDAALSAAYARLRALLLRTAELGIQRGVAEALAWIIEEGSYARALQLRWPQEPHRLAEARALVRRAQSFQKIGDFLETVSLAGRSAGALLEESAEAAEDRLLLSTVHQAKGLEWAAVFLIGLSQGSFPSWRALESEQSQAEERRLFYVALTRAQRFLHLCSPREISDRQQRRRRCAPSRFLVELERSAPDLMARWQLTVG